MLTTKKYFEKNARTSAPKLRGAKPSKRQSAEKTQRDEKPNIKNNVDRNNITTSRLNNDENDQNNLEEKPIPESSSTSCPKKKKVIKTVKKIIKKKKYLKIFLIVHHLKQ